MALWEAGYVPAGLPLQALSFEGQLQSPGDRHCWLLTAQPPDASAFLALWNLECALEDTGARPLE